MASPLLPRTPAADLVACGVIARTGMRLLTALVAPWVLLHPSSCGLTKYTINRAKPMSTGTNTPTVAPTITPTLLPLPLVALLALAAAAVLPLAPAPAKTGLLTKTPAYPAAPNDALVAAIAAGLLRLAARAEALAVALPAV